MKSIGFIGTGIMGCSMARNLKQKGFAVYIYSRTKAKAEPLIAEGFVWCESVAECAAGRDAVITIVGYPKDVEEVYFGEGGIIANAAPGCCIIDMTTTSPRLAKRIYAAAQEKGVFALDAPVTGGDGGAKAGTLSIMVGGDRAAFERCLPLFEAMGKTITYQGAAGNGQHVKMTNQIIIAGTISGVSEAMAYARAQGLDMQTVLDAVGGGSAASHQLKAMAPKMVEGDFSAGFFIKHFIKDMALAQQEATDAGLNLKVLSTVCEMYQALADEGCGNDGTQKLIAYYEK